MRSIPKSSTMGTPSDSMKSRCGSIRYRGEVISGLPGAGEDLAADLPVLSALHERGVEDLRHLEARELAVVHLEHVDRRLVLLWPRGRVLGKDLSDVEVVRVLHDGRVVVDLLPLDEHLVREGLILADASQRLDQRVHVRLDDALVSAQVGPGGGDHG